MYSEVHRADIVMYTKAGYTQPGTVRYKELMCSEWKKRFSRQFATRHCTALYSLAFNFAPTHLRLLCIFVHNVHFSACTMHSACTLKYNIAIQFENNCNAASSKPGGMHRHSTVQKIEIFTFPKRKFVIIVPSETCSLALQVNCHLIY